jgi:hypothetical protein
MASTIHGNPSSVIARSEMLAWAEGGDYYRVCSAVGTPIAGAITTSFSATAALFALVWGGTKLLIPHYLRLTCTTAPASATSSHMAIIADTINRYSSGGTDLLTLIKNARSDDSTASLMTAAWFGAVVAPAASAPRVLSRFAIKTQTAPAITVGDEIIVNFLGDPNGSGLTSGAATSSIVKNVGPVVLGSAAHSLLFHMWNPANAATAPQYEMEFAFWERAKAA